MRATFYRITLTVPSKSCWLWEFSPFHLTLQSHPLVTQWQMHFSTNLMHLIKKSSKHWIFSSLYTYYTGCVLWFVKPIGTAVLLVFLSVLFSPSSHKKENTNKYCQEWLKLKISYLIYKIRLSLQNQHNMGKER